MEEVKRKTSYPHAILYRTRRQCQLSSMRTLPTLLRTDPALTPLRRNHGSEYG